MPFNRTAEIGRVVLVNYGPDAGKLAVIVNILDQNRAQIDGPTTDVRRQVINFKRLAITDIKVKIGVGARAKSVRKAVEEAEVEKKWAATNWARRNAAKAKRAQLNDFDRFKIMKLRKRRSYRLRFETGKLLKQARATAGKASQD